MGSWGLSEDEHWMYQQAGLAAPTIKPRLIISIGGECRENDDLADLDALTAEFSGVTEGNAAPPVQNQRDGASELVDDLADLDELTAKCASEPGPAVSHTPESKVGPELPAQKRDWVDEALDAVHPGSGTLPYHAYRARRDLHDTLQDLRVLRNEKLVWMQGDHSGAGSEKRSRISIGNYSLFLINNKNNKELNKEERTTRVGGLATTLARNLPERAITVPELEGFPLPSWKDRGNEKDQPGLLRELVFGLQVASLVAGNDELTPAGWLQDVVPDDVGLLSIELPPDAASRFLRGVDGCAAKGLRRGLLRSLTSYAGDLEVVALWTANLNQPGGITLFLALRMDDRRSIRQAIELDRGKRVVRILESQGVRVGKGMHSIDQVCDSWLITPNQLVEDELSKQPIPPVCEIEEFEFDEYIARTGLAADDEIAEHERRAESAWIRVVHAHGLPTLFTGGFVKAIRDYLLRTPQHAKRRAQIVARMKKGSVTDAEKHELERLKCQDLPLTNMRFYKGSPAQFAAIAARSGEVLSGYCVSVHKAGQAKSLYEELRQSLSAKAP